MKECSFREGVIFFFLLFAGISLNAQEENLKFHSISLGLGIVEAPASSSGGGLSVMADVATKQGKGIFSLYVNHGEDLNVLGDESEYFLEGSLTYGRETNLLSWIKLEGHLGVGFFNHKFAERSENVDSSETSIGFPVRAKLIFFYKFLGIGINQNANLNPLVSTYSTDLVLQVIF